MSSEANVQLLKEAYRQWHDSKGQNVDYWFDNVIGPQITFDSIRRGLRRCRLPSVMTIARTARLFRRSAG